MYLRRLQIENNGPLRALSMEMPFAPEGAPRPVVLVGGNGSGKTTLLSIITDAMFEAAAAHYTDVVPDISSGSRPWFRVVGPHTISSGTSGSCVLLQFEHDEKSYVYKEKGGTLPASDILDRLQDLLKPFASWPDQGSVKVFEIPPDESKIIFEQGVYIYFPSNRAEIPHWLNSKSLPTEDFDFTPRYVKQLQKPIYVAQGLKQLKQWMLSLLVEIKTHFVVVPFKDGQSVPLAVNAPNALAHMPLWEAINGILQVILNDVSAQLVWAGRLSDEKIGFVRNGVDTILPLGALSAGQATLFNVFGTLLRYGDGIIKDAQPQGMTGICLIDEIDAHMHVDLQYRALPKLMRMFPKMQFIVSSHSPLFVLGMEKTNDVNKAEVIEMPSGLSIHGEAYAEFGRAMEVFQETKTFNQAMLDAARAPGKLLVLVEGETDPVYLTAAAELLDRSSLLDRVEFSWVGAKDPKSGQGFHTGKGALTTTAAVFRAKPEVIKRAVLLLYDNDANKAPEDQGNLYIRSMADNPFNSIIKKGIENLLPAGVITADMFDEKTVDKENGSSITTRNLNKMRLCKHLCETKRDPHDFTEFRLVLDMVESLVSPEIVAP